MHNFIVKLSSKIDNSTYYQKTKSFFRSLLEDVNYPYKKYFDGFMIFLIIVSIAILIMNKSGKVPDWLVKFDLYFVTSIFIFEYLLRLWISHDIHKYILVTQETHTSKERCISVVGTKVKYIFSLPALIDFIAIFPKFRIIRLFKLYHYMHGASSLFDALLKKRFEFIFLGYMLFGITFTFGSIFYLLEFGINKNLHSYLDAIYWALVTISTVGYGDISPVTPMGKIVSMFGIVFGIAMISFVTSVMVSAFSERFDKLRNQDSINYVNKMQDVVIINGYGYLGSTIANKLKLHKAFEPVIIENDEEKANRAIENGFRVIRADGSSVKLIKELYQRDNITAMLTLRSSDIDNIYFILNAKSTYANCVVYARMNNVALQPQYEATKVDGVVEPYAIVDIKAFEYLKKHIQKKQQSIFFFGYTHKSRALCKMLQNDDVGVHIYEADSHGYKEAKKDGFKQVELIDMKNAEIPHIQNALVVCAMKEEALNVYCSITLRPEIFANEIVALSDSKEDNRKLLLAGVDKIFDMYEESANQFIEMIEKSKKEKDV